MARLYPDTMLISSSKPPFVRHAHRHSLVLALALCACSGEKKDDFDGTDNFANTGDDASAGDGDAKNDGTCVADRLFSARPIGEDGTDVIRHIVADGAGKNVYFSGYTKLYRAPISGGEPKAVGDLLGTLDGKFWLSGEQVLVPGGLTLPIVEDADPVLLALPKKGGKLEPLVSIPHATTLNERYEVSNIQVLGDDVYWIGRDMHTDDPSDLPPVYQTNHVVRKTSWKNPDVPEELYSSKFELDELIVMPAHVLVSQRDSMGNDDYGSTQKLVGINGKVTDVEAVLGGVASAGQGDWLLVQRLDFAKPESSGVFRVRTDGTGASLVASGTGLLSGVAQDEDGFIAVVKPSSLGQDRDTTNVYAVGMAGEGKLIGCIDGDVTVHGVGVSASTAYVAINETVDGDYKGSILRFAR